MNGWKEKQTKLEEFSCKVHKQYCWSCGQNAQTAAHGEQFGTSDKKYQTGWMSRISAHDAKCSQKQRRKREANSWPKCHTCHLAKLKSLVRLAQVNTTTFPVTLPSCFVTQYFAIFWSICCARQNLSGNVEEIKCSEVLASCCKFNNPVSYFGFPYLI